MSPLAATYRLVWLLAGIARGTAVVVALAGMGIIPVQVPATLVGLVGGGLVQVLVAQVMGVTQALIPKASAISFVPWTEGAEAVLYRKSDSNPTRTRPCSAPALEKLAVTAAKTLMVRDRADRDSGAAAVGITTLILPPVKNDTARGLDVVLHLLQCA